MRNEHRVGKKREGSKIYIMQCTNLIYNGFCDKGEVEKQSVKTGELINQVKQIVEGNCKSSISSNDNFTRI